MIKEKSSLVALLCLLVLTQSVSANDAMLSEKCLRKDCFETELHSENRLQLKSIGRARWFGLLIYTAALYVGPETQSPESALEPTAKRLVLRYHKPISAEMFSQSAQAHIKKQDDNLSEDIWTGIQTMAVAYEDISPGDEYALEYIPGQGTTLFLNEQKIVVVEGDEFAAVYFGIWLAEDSINDHLRTDLLDWNKG